MQLAKAFAAHFVQTGPCNSLRRLLYYAVREKGVSGVRPCHHRCRV